MWVASKNNHKRELFQENCCFRSLWIVLCGQISRAEELILLLILIKGLLICICKKWVINVMTRTHGVLLQSTENKGHCVSWTVWIQWPGTLDPQEHKALVNTKEIKLGSISVFLKWQEQQTLLEIKISLSINGSLKHPIVADPETVYAWQRLSQERVLQGLKRALYLQLTAPGMETALLPAMDCPVCSGTGWTSRTPDLHQRIWGNIAEVFEGGKEIVQILLEADFATKQKKLGGSRDIQSKGICPYHMASCQAINLEKLAGGGSSAWGRAGHQSPSGEQLCCALFGLHIPLALLLLLLFSLPFLPLLPYFPGSFPLTLWGVSSGFSAACRVKPQEHSFFSPSFLLLVTQDFMGWNFHR